MRRLLLALPIILSPLAANADALIDGAKECTRFLPRYEREYGIPVHLLSAIASTESGRYHEGLKIALPWPWTINAEGKGHFFNSKQEAISAVRKLRAQGVKSIDVGCMQVNLLHHPQAFASLEDAFEPERNVAYSAYFLRTLYEETQSWKNAAAAYHSRTQARGAQYVSRVYDRWYNIIDRVRAAAGLKPSDRPVQLASADARTPLPAYVPPVPPKPKAPSYKSISVRNGDAPRRSGDLLVVRPESETLTASAPAVPELAPVAPKEIAMASPAAANAKVISISASGAAHTLGAPRASAPRFIFAD